MEGPGIEPIEVRSKVYRCFGSGRDFDEREINK